MYLPGPSPLSHTQLWHDGYRGAYHTKHTYTQVHVPAGSFSLVSHATVE